MRAGEAGGPPPPGRRGDVARWTACFLAVLALHGGAALALLAHSAENEAAGVVAAIPIELAELPAAATPAPEEDAVPGPEQMQADAADADAAETPPPELAEPAPEQAEIQPEPEPPETVAAIPEPLRPEPEPPPIPDLKPAPEPEVALAPPPEPQRQEPKREEPKREEPRRPEVRKPEQPREQPLERAKPREQPPEKPKREEAHKRSQPRAASAAATTAPVASRAVAAREAIAAGSAGASPSLPEWKVRLAAHLQRNKRYPAEAQAAGQEGVATLQFTVDRGGRITASSLVRSSGVPALDNETLALIRRAQPLPAPPPDVPGAQFSFSVPFRYSMR